MARDPGLQPERTSLAWHRTAFAMLVVSFLLIRDAVMMHSAWLGVTSAILVGASTLIAMIGSVRMRRLDRCEMIGAPHAALAAFTTGTACLAATAGLFVVMFP